MVFGFDTGCRYCCYWLVEGFFVNYFSYQVASSVSGQKSVIIECGFKYFCCVTVSVRCYVNDGEIVTSSSFNCTR